MQINPKTQLNMLIGYPLEHTQSPILHQICYQQLGINAVLLAQPSLQLKSLIQAIKILSVRLTAVTSPYKEKVIKYLDQCSSEASQLQAVNTIIQRDGKLYGYNTDIDGITFGLRDIAINDKQVLIIGAGGGARAMAYFLKKNHAKLFWINRTSKAASTLAKKWGGHVINDHELRGLEIDIIVNTTPVGLYPHAHTSPLPNYFFHKKQVVFDMVYNPALTTLLKEAKKQGAKIISGLEMFIGQGLKQIELITDQTFTPVMTHKLKKILIKSQESMYP